MKDIEQSPDGRNFALAYFNDGLFMLRIYMRDDSAEKEADKSNLSARTSIKKS